MRSSFAAWITSAVYLAAVLAARAAAGQTFAEPVDLGYKLEKPRTMRVQLGMTVTAQGGPCQGLLGTVPIPIDWPEQHVKVVGEDFSSYVKNVTYRTVSGTVKQMVIEIPFVPANEEARALVTFEVTRYTQTAPDETSGYVQADIRKLPREVRVYLAPSPYIESQNPRIKSLAREVLREHSDAPAWNQVEAIYDWVRENVTYTDGPLKGAFQALKDGSGDCEELSSLFIAMCRASNIPARTVWVPDHCYPEFYLEDAQGKGYWFACQAAGARDFGGMVEYRPILQKGDNFTTPERPRDKQRYVAEYLTGTGGKPKVRFIRDIVDAGL